MRFARIKTPAGPVHARLEGGDAIHLSSAPWTEGSAATGTKTRWTEEDLLCPVTPSKIIGIGRNYAAHAKELGNEVPGEPLLFLKPPSSLVGPGATVVLTSQSERVEHEAELGVVIGRRVKNVAAKDAMAAVFGYTMVNDVSARDLQKKDGQWTRAKGFDTFCPTGPWVETELSPDDLRVQCRVNGALRQDGRTSLMIFKVDVLVAFVSRVMTLEPGDVISTGTPEGVGPLADGDVCEVEVGTGSDGRELGILRVSVRGA